MIQVTDLAKIFETEDGPVLKDISFSLSPGDALCGDRAFRLR